MTIKNLKSGDIVYAHGNGSFTLDASCTGGSFRCAGPINLTDNSGGAVGILDDGRIVRSKITSDILDKVLSGNHDTAGTVGKVLQDIVEDTGEIGAAGVGLSDLGGMSTPMKAEVNAEVDTGLSDYDGPTRAEATTDKDAIITEINVNESKLDIIDTVVDAIKVKTDNLPGSIPKAVQLDNLSFLMVDETDGFTPETGLTVTGTIQQDAGTFTAVTNAITEISSGMYRITLTAAEMNADSVSVRFVSTGAADRFLSFRTDV